MLIAYEALFLVQLCLLVYCVLNIVTTPDDQLRHLPKLGWLLLVIVLPLAGGITWLVAGRPTRPARSLPNPPAGDAPVTQTPSRGDASNPDDDAAFMASLRLRAEQQRQAAADQARELRRGEDGAS